MITLTLLLVFVLLVLAMSVSSANRRRRRLLEAERRRQAELARGSQRGGAQGPVSPFAGMPLGSVFEQLLTGPGSWSRALEYDERTGRWVDVTERPPEAVEQAPADPRRERRSRARTGAPPQTANPLTSLLGGLGGNDGGGFEVQPPDGLIDFDDVGGMDALKQEVRDTVGLMLEHPGDAARYGIEWNGILLHGPPGVGKTYFAQAIAGEYGMSFIHVSTGDLISSMQGGSARNIDKAFQTALQNLPACCSSTSSTPSPSAGTRPRTRSRAAPSTGS